MTIFRFLRQIRDGWLTADFWLCTVLMFLVEFGCAVLGAPSPRLLEIAVCQDYYQKKGTTWTHEDCKIQEVQVRLGFMLTVLSTCSILAATVMQMPMGLLADKKGIRVALLLNIVSTILYWGWMPFAVIISDLPIQALYAAPVFVLIGGGPWASGALIFSALNQGITPSQRTPAFSIMEAVSGVADLVGPALGALTMEDHIWLPFSLATLSFALMFVPAAALGDTKMRSVTGPNEMSADTGSVQTTDNEEQPLLHDIRTSHYARHPERVESACSKAVLYGVTFGSFFLLSLARDANNFLIPWISWRFDESMARAGLIFSLRAVVSFVLFFALLPLASEFVSRVLRIESSTRDLFISAFSCLVLFAGSFVVAVSSDLASLALGFCIMTLGSGATVSLRAFIASKVNNSSSGRIFAASSTSSTVGSLVGMPLMGTLYSLNISKEVIGISFPFATAAMVYLLVSYVVFALELAT